MKVVNSYYDKEYDILSFNWGKCEQSMECFNGQLIIDFDKKGDVVGFEMFDFEKELKKGVERIQKMIKESKTPKRKK